MVRIPFSQNHIKKALRSCNGFVKISVGTLVLFATGTTVFAADPFDLMNQADALYKSRTEMAGGLESAELYEQAASSDTASAVPVWKACRSYHWAADHTVDKKKKLALFEKGMETCKKAITLEPKSIEAHFWLGAMYGSYGEAKGVLKSLALVKPIRAEMDAVIRLDDRYKGGGGYRVLGIVDYKVPGFAGGSKKRALERLNKAIGIDPDHAFNQYYIAEYFSITGDEKNALEHLDILEKMMPTSDVDMADLSKIQEKGKKLRANLR